MTNDPLASLDEDARRFLDGARVGRLATADAEGAPHVIPVCFALAAGRIYSVVDEKPKRTTRLVRLRNIEANPNVALVVDRYDEDWSRLVWVQVRGEASVLESGAAYERGLDALRQKYEQYLAMNLDGRPLIEVTPGRVTAWRAGP
jgi:PPOX class probable F420-dependent enzyme